MDEIIGQEAVKQAIKVAFVSGKLAHAYLFTGPRGTGKTSTARILAKMVNCSAEQNIPCNKCDSCLSITDGSNLDVVEMDAASNRGIDDIRTLRENIKLSPTAAKKKVYIIDEVHMLSNDAFNALLKTLEEPPSHVLFVLATTEVQKIPATILSRVTRFDFKQATIEELLQALKNVAKAEKLEITDEALLSLAKVAGGSFRDGVKFLDLLSSFGKIDQKVVEENLRRGVFEEICLILESIAQKDGKEALLKLTAQLEIGANVKELNLEILDILRQLIFIKHNLGPNIVQPEVGADKFKLLENLADKFEPEQLITVLDNFQKSLERSRYVSIATLPLEMAVVESSTSKSSDQMKSDKSDKTSEPEKSEPLIHRPTDTPVSSDLSESSSSSDLQKIQEKWSYVLETVKAYNFSLEALLRSSRLLSCEDGIVMIEVPYSFHQRILEAPKSKDLIESIFADVAGKQIKVSTLLGQRPVRVEEIANVEVAADDDVVRLAAEIFSSDQTN